MVVVLNIGYNSDVDSQTIGFGTYSRSDRQTHKKGKYTYNDKILVSREEERDVTTKEKRLTRTVRERAKTSMHLSCVGLQPGISSCRLIP